VAGLEPEDLDLDFEDLNSLKVVSYLVIKAAILCHYDNNFYASAPCIVRLGDNVSVLFVHACVRKHC